ncbi:hypothetical protein EDD22DRAFT_1053151 [Suillus occidentalis]|nr:hypothetical protein EDD22DRAFT_1053151 [Suillus occidentalis]
MICRKFSDPALNMLWCEQYSLTPLIMCLPKETWEATHNGTRIVFTREPSLTDWEPVRINASRIRRLVAHPDVLLPCMNPSGPVLRALFALFPPRQLFPNIRALHFGAVSQLPEFHSDFPLLRQFLSPELETLSFNLPVDGLTSEVEQFLGALSAELPNLNKLPIVGWDVGVTWHNIPNIQHSHRLQSLSLSVREPEKPSGNGRLNLSTLKHLSVDGFLLQDCTAFLLQVATPQLSAIEISYNHMPASPAQITAVIESLATSCRTFGSLEKFFLIDYSMGLRRDFDPHSLLHSHIFRPLLKYRRLSTVNFGDIGRYCLDDVFVEDVAVAWPGLRELKFAEETRQTTDVTFAAMLSLASKCKSLHILQLSFNATDFPTLPHAPDGTRELWPTQTALHEPHVAHSVVSEASSFHLFLAVVFPSLARLIHAEHLQFSKIKELWEQLLKEREMNPAIVATWRDSLLQPQP